MLKEHAKLIKSFDLPVIYADFNVSVGIYRYDKTEQFLFEIEDLYNQEEYTHHFNSEWCPEEMKEWLAGVIVDLITKSIRRAQGYYIIRLK
jgi:hypothetical protein